VFLFVFQEPGPVVHTIARSVELDDVAVEQDAVQYRRCKSLVTKDFHPLGRCLVGGDDDGGLLVEGIDEIEEGHGLFPLERHQGDFVNAKETASQDAVVCGHGFGQGVLCPEDSDILFHGSEHGISAAHYGIMDEAGGDIGLAGAAGPHEDDIVGLVHPQQFPELPQPVLGHSGPVGEVELVQVAVTGQMRPLDAAYDFPLPPHIHLSFQRVYAVFQIGGGFHLCLVQDFGEVSFQMAQLENMGIPQQLIDS